MSYHRWPLAALNKLWMQFENTWLNIPELILMKEVRKIKHACIVWCVEALAWEAPFAIQLSKQLPAQHPRFVWSLCCFLTFLKRPCRQRRPMAIWCCGSVKTVIGPKLAAFSFKTVILLVKFAGNLDWPMFLTIPVGFENRIESSCKITRVQVVFARSTCNGSHRFLVKPKHANVFLLKIL